MLHDQHKQSNVHPSIHFRTYRMPVYVWPVCRPWPHSAPPASILYNANTNLSSVRILLHGNSDNLCMLFGVSGKQNLIICQVKFSNHATFCETQHVLFYVFAQLTHKRYGRHTSRGTQHFLFRNGHHYLLRSFLIYPILLNWKDYIIMARCGEKDAR